MTEQATRTVVFDWGVEISQCVAQHELVCLASFKVKPIKVEVMSDTNVLKPVL